MYSSDKNEQTVEAVHTHTHTHKYSLDNSFKVIKVDTKGAFDINLSSVPFVRLYWELLRKNNLSYKVRKI